MVPDLSSMLSRALGRLLWQWRNLPTDTNMQRLVSVSVGQLEPLADALVALVEERTIDTAVGAQLDQWGTVLALPRDGRTDDAYRIALRARLAVYMSNGTPENLITITRLLVGDVVVELLERPFASVYIQWEAGTPTPDDERPTVQAQLQASAPAGVEVVAVEAVPGFFGFESDPLALGFDEGELAFRL